MFYFSYHQQSPSSEHILRISLWTLLAPYQENSVSPDSACVPLWSQTWHFWMQICLTSVNKGVTPQSSTHSHLAVPYHACVQRWTRRFHLLIASQLEFCEECSSECCGFQDIEMDLLSSPCRIQRIFKYLEKMPAWGKGILSVQPADRRGVCRTVLPGQGSGPRWSWVVSEWHTPVNIPGRGGGWRRECSGVFFFFCRAVRHVGS